VGSFVHVGIKWVLDVKIRVCHIGSLADFVYLSWLKTTALCKDDDTD